MQYKNQAINTFVNVFGKSYDEFNSMPFFNFGLYGDFLLTEEFEMYRHFNDFEEELWESLYSMMNALLLNTLSDHTRLLKVSKQLSQPMKELKMLANSEELSVSYRIYSAHDTNVAAWLMVLG
jgi:hypothetical protein